VFKFGGRWLLLRFCAPRIRHPCQALRASVASATMNMFQAFMVVLVLIATLVAVKYILGRKTKPTGPCVSAVASLILPAGASSAPVECCTGGDGKTCLPDYTSAYGTVTLVPTTISAACPPQTLAPAQYAGYLSSPAGNSTGTADVAGLGKLYTAGTGCGEIQVALTRLCSPVGSKEDPSTCRGGIAAVQGSMSQTLSCPGGSVQATRRLVMPGDLSKATCAGGGSSCCTHTVDVGGPVPNIVINATTDGTPSPCPGQPLTELLYYQCMSSAGS